MRTSAQSRFGLPQVPVRSGSSSGHQHGLFTSVMPHTSTPRTPKRRSKSAAMRRGNGDAISRSSGLSASSGAAGSACTISSIAPWARVAVAPLSRMRASQRSARNCRSSTTRAPESRPA
jgi:hypothetical protein